MNIEHITLICLLAGAFILFISGRLPPDLVALFTLLLAVLFGIVAPQDAFTGFSNPAVITVATVLVLSNAMQQSSALDWVVSPLLKQQNHPRRQLFMLAGIACLLSGFMNNVGALALIMPIALQTARQTKTPPSELLMPIAFASILGGLMTLIGTPANILVANYRASVQGESFQLFDFLPIGITLAITGLVLIIFFSRFLLPKRATSIDPEAMFEINDYIIEVRVNQDSSLIGHNIDVLENDTDGELEVVGLLRGKKRLTGKYQLRRQEINEKDILIFRADTHVLKSSLEKFNLSLTGDVTLTDSDFESDDIVLLEAVVTPGSRLEKRSYQGLRLRSRYGIALLGIARQGRPFKNRLNHVKLRAGDILLFQGDNNSLLDNITRLGCLPLAERDIKLNNKTEASRTLICFAGALIATLTGVTPVHISFSCAIAILVLLKTLSMRDVYNSIDWPIILLLAGLIPVGQAIETTGMANLISSQLAEMAKIIGPVGILALLMILTMTLSDIMNNAATAVILAPIAMTLAIELNVNPDAYLMAVAIGASCAFLTPIGHQNNILIMGPGGYHFGDYWRLGLPLEIMIICISVPMIYCIWGI